MAKGWYREWWDRGIVDVRRVTLPSGGWWTIRTRPTWEDVGNLGDDGEGRLDRLLLAITETWSFEETVSSQAMVHRDDNDVEAVMEAVNEDVVPWLDREAPETMAKELFAGMSTGRVPAQFFEVRLMAATGWSWHDLQTAPADIVLKMAVFLAVSLVKMQGGALRFAQETGSQDGAAMSASTGGDEADD